MGERGNLILAIVMWVILLIALICTIIIFRRKKRYIETTLSLLDAKNKEYFMSLKLVNGYLFPYHEKVKTGIRNKYNAKDETDNLTSIKLKPHYAFFEDRIIYIINNDLHYPKSIVTVDGVPYIEIDDNIEVMELLITNERPSHYLLKYSFHRSKDKKSFVFDVEEVVEYGN